MNVLLTTEAAGKTRRHHVSIILVDSIVIAILVTFSKMIVLLSVWVSRGFLIRKAFKYFCRTFS